MAVNVEHLEVGSPGRFNLSFAALRAAPYDLP